MWLYESIIKSIDDYLTGETFEDYIERGVLSFYGKSKQEIESNFDKKIYRANDLLKSIFGIKSKKISEFEKAGVFMKTIRVELNGRLRSGVSFKQIQYKEIVYEDWLSSSWFEELNRRFFFVVFQADSNGEYRLKKVKFWSIPQKDMNTLKEVWFDTKRKIKKGDFEHFIKASDKKVGHVRPKAKDAKDTMETADGTFQKKKSFWLNNGYIKKVVNSF